MYLHVVWRRRLKIIVLIQVKWVFVRQLPCMVITKRKFGRNECVHYTQQLLLTVVLVLPVYMLHDIIKIALFHIKALSLLLQSIAFTHPSGDAKYLCIWVTLILHTQGLTRTKPCVVVAKLF